MINDPTTPPLGDDPTGEDPDLRQVPPSTPSPTPTPTPTPTPR